ncbi:hypothetical protein RFI_02962 [Reticulomyxa filosa]|uniref:Kinesin motor domain-containing protein n=1 Tax=Reticulomyxa filosa TaxID=46433 RepID=X6P911_RETFI|nr:hypothetical protein RFI_02962 [Reticulomyxa filosa]|eukprot:ETO34132.1 hypothetical protein RFI_02962 [Reticulomyxa filosa]
MYIRICNYAKYDKEQNEELENELNAREDENNKRMQKLQRRLDELERENEIKRTSTESGRLEKFQMQAQMEACRNQCVVLEQAKERAVQQVATLQSALSLKELELEKVQPQLEHLREQSDAQNKQIAELNATIQQMQFHLNSSKQEIQQAKTENMSLQLKNQSLSNGMENQIKQIAELDSARQNLESTIALNNAQLFQKNRNFRAENAIRTAEHQFREKYVLFFLYIGKTYIKCIYISYIHIYVIIKENNNNKNNKDEEYRKQLHNKIQELKGNIRVYCRIRPFLSGEEKGNEMFEYPEQTGDQQSIVLVGESTVNVSGQKVESKLYPFSFDRVFKPSERQTDVFNEISQLVQSALDGYKVCIFAYGQTGSGKTYTMEGPSLNYDDNNRGMIPRAVEQIFYHAETLASKGWKYQFFATFLEIYNEKVNFFSPVKKKIDIRDLLAPRDDVYLELTLKKDNKNKNEVEVSGLTHCNVQCPQDVYPLLLRASKNRSTGKTDCNERSSRSHSVFQLFLKGFNTVTQQQIFGALNLIDLAGSERLKKSNAQGQQLVETQNINSSLSCLGDVIHALVHKNKHVPYRNSKLTHLLMNYFGGQSKTLMFVNLCPEFDKLDGIFCFVRIAIILNFLFLKLEIESLCSLRFAAKVNECHIGVARRSTTNQLAQ